MILERWVAANIVVQGATKWKEGTEDGDVGNADAQ